MTLLVGSIFHMTHKIVSEMTYNVSMETLNPTIPYHTKLMAVTSSIINRFFKKSFHHWKIEGNFQKTDILFPTPLKYAGIQKFKSVVKLPNKIKTRIISVENESFIHIAEWILLLSQQLLNLSNVCSHTCAKTPTPLVDWIVNDALVHSMPNVQQTLLLPFMIFNCLKAYH